MPSVSANRSCVPDDQIFSTIKYGIQGSYGFSSILIYITNIWALRRLNHTFNRTFTRLYIASALWSSLYFLWHYLVRRFLALGYFCEFFLDWLMEPNWIILPYRISTSYCPIMILFVHFMISAHRVSAVLAPIKSKQFWENNVLLLLCIGLLIPFIFMWFVVPCRGYAYIAPSGGLGFDYERINTFMGPLSASFFSAIAAIIFGSLTIFNTFVTFIVVKTKKLKKDSGLLIFEVLLAGFTLVYAATQTVLYFSMHLFPDPTMQEVVEEIRHYILDLFILPQAWTLFFCNKSIRRETFNIFGIPSKTQLNTVPSSKRSLANRRTD